MLSRVANSIYWFGRNTERVENTARLVRVNANLLLDLPRRSGEGWAPLIAITGSRELFYSLYTQPDETSVVRFLLVDDRNPNSVISTLANARENLRTTRDIIPREVWEQVNRLHIYVGKQGGRGIQGARLHDFLDQIVLGSHLISGLLTGTMSTDVAYQFVRMGFNIERADMTTRIIDVRAADLRTEPGVEHTPYQNLLWMSILKSLTADHMYRRHMRQRVSGPDVLWFLLKDTAFPRTVLCCLSRIDESLKRAPGGITCQRTNARLRALVQDADVPRLIAGHLHEFLDEIQIGLSDLNRQIGETFFS
jgi:uncharacterized alpha-E superfamily protein